MSEAVGGGFADVVAALLRTAPRGRCDNMAALCVMSGSETRMAVAASRACPPGLRTALAAASTGDVRLAATAAGSTIRDSPHQLFRHNEAAAAWASKVPDPASSALMARIVAQAPRSRGGASIAANRHARLGVLIRLACNDLDEVRQAVAQNPSAGPETLALLSVDPVMEIAAAAIANSGCPHALVLVGAVHGTNELKAAAAANPSAGDDLLRALCLPDDSDRSVRAAAAANPNTPPDAIERLTDDRYRSVRAAAAANPNTPPDAMERLAGDSDRSVRAATAANPNTSSDAMERLADDRDRYVRAAAATNPICGSGLLERLARDNQMGVRAAVAANPACPPATFSGLVGDRNDAAVQRSVARNRSIAPGDAAQLAKYGGWSGAAVVAVANPSCPYPLVVQHARSGRHNDRPIAVSAAAALAANNRAAHKWPQLHKT